MVAALKAPLPDGSQLAAFAAVLGDATESEAECEGENVQQDVSDAAFAMQAQSAVESPEDAFDGEGPSSNVEVASFQHAYHGVAG